ncbi:MAG: hypothetical protein O7E52_00690 [Candidatus Poribacteria bacterium]|nr:hypothetical protein [Candidatus Poribacteria bacterium]
MHSMNLVEVLERSPLYQWVEVEMDQSASIHSFALPTFSAYCGRCKAERSFGSGGRAWGGGSVSDIVLRGKTLAAICVCLHCHHFWRGYILHFHEDGTRIMKAGQYPPWDLSIDRRLTKMLGKHEGIFKKGFICEAQGFGIGAYAYYRRIVEMIIDELLVIIESLIEGAEKDRYIQALERVKTTRQTDEKIRLVKDLLPSTLKPDGYNPLGVLHQALSEGIHQLSEGECLNRATEIRTVLVFLINQVQHQKEERKEFTEGMRKLLEKRGQAPSGGTQQA